MSPVARIPAAAAQVDLTARQVVVAACAAMGLVTAVDLIDGRLGAIFSIGFVMVVVAAALAVDTNGFLVAGLLPPLLLLFTLIAVAIVASEAIAVQGMPADVSAAGRVVAGVFDRGVALLVGYGCALGIIALRSTSER